jgi:hypothetical protein
MKTIISLVIACTLLSACSQTSAPSFPRAHGEDWKFYPFEPGYSFKVAEQGRTCWAEKNRENWDQCS